MRLFVAALGLLALLAPGCGKNADHGRPQPPATDRFDVLLREMSYRNSINPYYFFTYDDSGYATSLSYQADMYVYNYFYKHGLIDSVAASSTDARYFLYRYTGRRVTQVLQYDDTGLRTTVSIVYDDRGRVIQMHWQPVTPGPDEKHSVFTYYNNGNLKRVEHSYPVVGLSSSIDFEAYDNKVCVDDFSITKDYLEHVILLPGVRFQYNNPTRMRMTNGKYVRVSRLSYRYHGNLPAEQHSTTEEIEGPNAGNTYTGSATYTYYY